LEWAPTLLSAAAARGSSAPWPTRAVTVVVPYAPGGNTDMMARLASQYMADKLGQPSWWRIPVRWRRLGRAVAVAKASPTATRCCSRLDPDHQHPDAAERVSYDPEKDLAPISDLRRGALSPRHQGVAAGEHAREFIVTRRPIRASSTIRTAGVRRQHPSQHRAVSDAGRSTTWWRALQERRAPMAALVAGEVEMYFGMLRADAAHRQQAIKILAVSTCSGCRSCRRADGLRDLFRLRHLVVERLLRADRHAAEIVDVVARETIAAAKQPAIVERLNRLAILPFGTTPGDSAT